MKYLFSIVSLTIFTATSFAIPVKEAKTLSFVQAAGDKVSVKTETYEALSSACDLTFKSVSPHLMLNPTKKVSEWKGLGFRTLMNRFNRDLKGDEEVTLAAADGYAAQLNARDFLDVEGMIAMYEDGKLLEPRRGGPQSIWPSTNPKLPPDMLCDCWGVWYITAIILGDLPSRLDLIQGKNTKSVMLTPGVDAQVKATPFRSPTGHFKFLRTGKIHFMSSNPKVTYEPLDKILKTRFGVEPKPLIVDTYYGKEIPLDKPAEWNIEYLWQGKPISAKVGGPFHICHSTRRSDCIFFVRSLRVKG